MDERYLSRLYYRPRLRPGHRERPRTANRATEFVPFHSGLLPAVVPIAADGYGPDDHWCLCPWRARRCGAIRMQTLPNTDQQIQLVAFGYRRRAVRPRSVMLAGQHHRAFSSQFIIQCHRSGAAGILGSDILAGEKIERDRDRGDARFRRGFDGLQPGVDLRLRQRFKGWEFTRASVPSGRPVFEAPISAYPTVTPRLWRPLSRSQPGWPAMLPPDGSADATAPRRHRCATVGRR